MSQKLVRSVPVVMQMEATECGAACLDMILAHYGRWVPLEQVRTSCGVSRDGSKAENICKAAQSYKMDAQMRSCSAQELRETAAHPCIVSWKGKGFVVLCGFSGGKAYLNDPGRGAIRVSSEAFDRDYGGIVLEMHPSDAFEKGGQRPSTWKFAKQRLRGMRAPIVFAIVGASQFMWHLLHLPVGFYEQRTVGDLQQRQEANETVAATLVQQLAPAMFNVILLVLYLVVMLGYSWKLTLVGLATVVINSLVANRVSRARVNITRQQMRDRGLLYSSTIAGIESIETIKASGAEEGYFERWSGYQAMVNDANVRFNKIDVYFGTIPQYMANLANIAVLVLGTYLIMSGEISTGVLLAFQGLLSSFMSPVDSIIKLGQQVQEMRTSMERVQDVLEYPPDAPEEDPERTEVNSKLSGELEIDHVSFGYSPLEDPLISDFSLKIEPGDWVAFVGSSGSGKSTIAKLVSGLYEPWEGEIRFDGELRSDIDSDRLHSSLAVVSQDVTTFADTVDANIRLWDDTVMEYDVILAARDAGVHDDILRRELGYHELIAPRGRNFSGGQLQRLEIARALASDPTIIILDEATSALDAKTEAHVIQSIRDRGITCIVVAHRLSTIRDCDEIIVLDEGNVVERGTHNELISKNGAYATLVRNN